MVLISILILYVIAFIVLLFHRLNLRPGYSWFLSVGGSISVWILLLLSYQPEPQMITLMIWETDILFETSHRLVLDMYSWSLSIGITTLMVSALLTEVARINDVRPGSWATSFAFVGTGILAITAASPITLLMSWALMDIIEVYTLLKIVPGSNQRERVVVSFSARVVGLMLVVAAYLRAEAVGTVFDLTNLPAESAGYLILAVGLRLGVIPPHPTFLDETFSRRSMGTIIRLIPASASLVLLARIAEVGVSFRWELGLMGISIWALVYGSFTWLFASNELDGRPYWIISISALAVVSTIQTDPTASLFWGLSLVFSGGMLFLYSTHSPRFTWLLFFGYLGFSALPFTPAWRGAILFSKLHWSISIVSCFSLAVLMVGYLKHTIRIDDSGDEIERWVWVIYPIGLIILPLTHFGVIWVLGGSNFPKSPLFSLDWWWGLIALGCGALIWYTSRLPIAGITKVVNSVQNIFSLNWFYRFIWWIYRTTSRLISYTEQILEGEGGVLWAVLIITLMVLFFAQSGGG